MKNKRVVITGVGLLSCYGSCVQSFFSNLLQKKSGVKTIPAWKEACHGIQIGAPVQEFTMAKSISKRDQRRLEAGIVYALTASEQALDHSGLVLDDLDKRRVGSVIGSGMGGVTTFIENTNKFGERGSRGVSPFFIPYILSNMGSARVAIEYGLQGPNYSISAACATANYAIIAAAKHIRNNDADVVLCGGVEASMTPLCVAGFNALKALSRNNQSPEQAVRPWDTKRDGFVLGDGCCVLVLEELEHAKRRNAHIFAEYCGGATTTDAYHMTTPDETGSVLADCIEKALFDASLKKEQIDCINAHATATQLGDLAEICALRRVFSKRLPNMYLHATKSLMGHTLGASGAFEAVVLSLSLQQGVLHPTANVEHLEPEVQDLNIVKELTKVDNLRYGISNSAGFGGHNSCIVLSKYEN